MFNVLNVRSVDMTATARIRDAAIEQFGQHDFGVSLRAIAEEIRVADTEALQRGHDG